MTDPAGRDEPWHTLSVKRIVRAGAWTVAFLVVILTGDAAIRFITGAPAVFDVNAWAIVKCLVQVFAAACIADVLSRRWEGTWFADACIAAPVATFVLWAGLNVVEMDIGTWPYAVLFVATFLTHLAALWTRRRKSRGSASG
ncbi:MAG: hypothetical protein OXI66_11905 [Boseongicola sp.]|nr:hypothetical protein [Boseongicola sp.]MDE0346463.1 hypothetical protein [Boseongicola sp.]MXW87839.1 hypothetical protein [Boseongicola sp. SB0667_bin_21]MYI69589.1 hypothetical protein [Boseongicola sp. SB0673_bin_14]